MLNLKNTVGFFLSSEALTIDMNCNGQNISSTKWIEYMNLLLENLFHRTQYVAVKDDLLVHSMRKHHMDRLESFFKPLWNMPWKYLQRSAIFRKEMVYMGNLFSIKDQRMTISPLRYGVENIQKTPPKNFKQCKCFYGIVIYPSISAHIYRNYYNPNII